MSPRTSKVLRSRAQSTSSLRQPLSTVIPSSQPTIRVVQPSPRITRSRPARNKRVLTQPLSVNLSASPNHDPDGPTTNKGTNVNNNTNVNNVQTLNECVMCPICALEVQDDSPGCFCDKCHSWFHPDCIFMSNEDYINLGQSNEPWFCDHCKSILANHIKWGDCEGEDAINSKIQAAYKEIVTWRKNLFLLPRGKAATDFIKEMTRLIYLFVNKTKWERLALSLLHIFLPIMLQKPSRKSKARDHAKYLSSRLLMWSSGDIDGLMAECRQIQKRLSKQLSQKEESKRKAFVRFMLVGKVRQALGFINSDNDVTGVHSPNDEIQHILQMKHPSAEPASPEVLLPITSPPPQTVVFENIDAELVLKSSMSLHGSGGPTLIDSDGWKHILNCKSYARESHNLADAIANFAKRLCSEPIHPGCLKEFIASRLIPLNKGNDSEGRPGVRPIGIGEILRRIIGKCVVSLLKSDIQYAAGGLQMCTGIRSGIEAAVHMNERSWSDDNTEAILLVDADNAFNRLNRKVALHNIQEICPYLHTYLSNHYQAPASLFVSNTDCNFISLDSEEGCTQGDVSAMSFYALGIKPLVSDLAQYCCSTDNCQQSWYADDSGAIGRLLYIRRWWDRLILLGPKYGYFPKPSKTVLLLKNPNDLERAQAIFEGTGVQFTTDGHRYLGAAIGSPDFKSLYVKDKIRKWCLDIEELSLLAVEEPQAALAAYTKGICHRWTFIQRTMDGISSLFSPLEKCLRQKFLPAVVGREISDIERKILSLPVRFGGLGVANPVETSQREYQASKALTEDLAELLYRQEEDLSLFDMEKQISTLRELKKNKETYFNNCHQELIEKSSDETVKRNLMLNKEKGSGIWLTVLPLANHGFLLNKQEFRDAMCLRYGWQIHNTPPFCGCGQRNSVDHTLICKKGGYVAMRHNNLRDLNCELQREVCRDVVLEPQLLPLDTSDIQGVQGDRAAPDISSRGLWSTFERTFFDVRVLHPNAPSYQTTDLAKLYKKHEQEKMRKYNTRVITVERGSFTPLIYTTFGGWGPQTTRYHKRLAEKIAAKRNEKYSLVLSHMRAQTRFSLLRSVLVAVRGERGKRSSVPRPLSSTSFNLIPNAMHYECF